MKTAFNILKTELDIPKSIKASDADSVKLGTNGVYISDVLSAMEKYASQWRQKDKPTGTRFYGYCDYCDGCGWYEGGKTLMTECEHCKGTGLKKKPKRKP